MPEFRTDLEMEMVQAVIDSRLIDFEAAGAILSQYGARAALEGTGIVFHVTKWIIRDWCIPRDPFGPKVGPEFGQQLSELG